MKMPNTIKKYALELGLPAAIFTAVTVSGCYNFGGKNDKAAIPDASKPDTVSVTAMPDTTVHKLNLEKIILNVKGYAEESLTAYNTPEFVDGNGVLDAFPDFNKNGVQDYPTEFNCIVVVSGQDPKKFFGTEKNLMEHYRIKFKKGSLYHPNVNYLQGGGQPYPITQEIIETELGPALLINASEDWTLFYDQDKYKLEGHEAKGTGTISPKGITKPGARKPFYPLPAKAKADENKKMRSYVDSKIDALGINIKKNCEINQESLEKAITENLERNYKLKKRK